jgi:hypothetical protein
LVKKKPHILLFFFKTNLIFSRQKLYFPHTTIGLFFYSLKTNHATQMDIHIFRILCLLISTFFGFLGRLDTIPFTPQNKKLFFSYQNYYWSLLSLQKKLIFAASQRTCQSNHLEHLMSYLCKSSCTIDLAMFGLDSSEFSSITKKYNNTSHFKDKNK